MTLDDLLGLGEVDAVQEQAEARLAENANDVEARVALARLALLADDLEGAEALVAGLPDGAGGYGRGLVDATVLVARGNLDAAEAAFRELAKQTPERSEAMVGLAEVAVAKGDGALAVKALKKAALAEPENWWLHYRLGIALADVENVEEAVTHLARAMELNPDDERPVAALAAGLMEADQLDAAEELLRDFFERDLETPQLLAILVQVLVRKGELDEARNLAVLTADANPDQPALQTEAARLLLTDGDVKGAIERCEKIIAAGTATPTTFVVRAQAAELADPPDVQTARKHYEAALELEPDDAGVHTNFGLLLLQVGELDESTKHLGRALELAPDSSPALYNMGLLQARRGDNSKARATLQQALSGADPLLKTEVERLMKALP